MIRDAGTDLRELRETIDRLDGALAFLLAERFAITERIGELKAAADLPSLDPAREDAQRERLTRLAREAGVELRLLTPVFEALTATVRRRHDEIRQNHTGR